MRILSILLLILSAQWSFAQSYSAVKQEVRQLREDVDDMAPYARTSTTQSYLKVTGDLDVGGNISFTNTVWDDLTISALNLFDPPGAAGVTIAGVTNGLFAAEFDAGESGAGIGQMKHSYKAGTAIEPHLHVVGRSLTPVTNVWGLTVNSAPIHGQFTNTWYYQATSVVERSKHHLVGFPPYAPAMSESAIISFVVTNVSGAASYLLDIDFHFESDKLGTDNELPDGI